MDVNEKKIFSFIQNQRVFMFFVGKIIKLRDLAKDLFWHVKWKICCSEINSLWDKNVGIKYVHKKSNLSSCTRYKHFFPAASGQNPPQKVTEQKLPNQKPPIKNPPRTFAPLTKCRPQLKSPQNNSLQNQFSPQQGLSVTEKRLGLNPWAV